jgi:hypothetical protein
MSKKISDITADSVDDKILKQIESLPRNYLDLYSLYSIAEQAFVDYQKLLVQAIESKDTEDRTWLVIRRFQCRDIVIVFSHLFMEAVIYDYGATNTSDSFMKKYVDKLDFLAKWVLIPRLVTGTSFPTDSQAFELMNKLKKARNDLVHFKTKKSPSNADSLQETESWFEGGMEVKECFDCMSEALKELYKLGEQKWLLFEWAFIKHLMEKSHRDIIDLVTDRIRSSLGISVPKENIQE